MQKRPQLYQIISRWLFHNSVELLGRIALLQFLAFKDIATPNPQILAEHQLGCEPLPIFCRREHSGCMLLGDDVSPISTMLKAYHVKETPAAYKTSCFIARTVNMLSTPSWPECLLCLSWQVLDGANHGERID